MLCHVYLCALSSLAIISWRGRWRWLLYLVVFLMSKLWSVALSNVTVGVVCIFEIVVLPDDTACTDPGNIVGGAGGGGRPIRHKLFSHQLNLRFFSKKTILFQDSRGGPTFSGGEGGFKYKNPINFWFSWGWVRTPSGSSHENSLFRCFANGLKMCMPCALDIIVKLFSLSLFYELVIDICILDTILMLPEFDPESGALATVGEFVLIVTITLRHLHFKWRNELQQQQQQWIDSKWKLRKSPPHVLSDVLSNENKSLWRKGYCRKTSNCSIDVTYFMCSDPSKWKWKVCRSVSIGKKMQQMF